MMTSMCVYRVKAGREQEFEELLGQHWPTLRSLELVSDAPSILYRGRDDDGLSFYVEFLTWTDADGPETAEKLPEVAAVWEPMGMLCQDRSGRPAMEFPVVERIALHDEG